MLLPELRSTFSPPSSSVSRKANTPKVTRLRIAFNRASSGDAQQQDGDVVACHVRLEGHDLALDLSGYLLSALTRAGLQQGHEPFFAEEGPVRGACLGNSVGVKDHRITWSQVHRALGHFRVGYDPEDHARLAQLLHVTTRSQEQRRRVPAADSGQSRAALGRVEVAVANGEEPLAVGLAQDLLVENREHLARTTACIAVALSV